MPVVALMPAGSIGLVSDVNPAELPPTAWSGVENVRFVDGKALPMLQDATLAATASFQGNWACPGASADVLKAIWLVTGAAKAKCLTDNTVTDVTRVSGDYTGAEDRRWNGGVLGGVVVANNGVDVPQAWLDPAAVNKLVDLANWPANTKAAVVRVFKQFLVALDITKTSTRYPTLVKWSHPADPGSVPVSWNEADPTRDAGETPLSETVGACVDCLPLKDTNIIYKQDSVWGMQYVGGAFIFRFYKIFGDWGMPVPDCAVEFMSGRHFVFTGTDLVVHDGNSVKSVATGRVRKLIRRISNVQLKTCYTVLNGEREEVWFCYRRATDSLIAADTALVYNWTNETMSVRQLNNLRYIGSGRVDPSLDPNETWNAASGEWDTDTVAWGDTMLFPSVQRLFGIGTEQLTWVDAQTTAVLAGKLEREHLGIAMRSGQAPDMASKKFVQRVWPRITGTTGMTVLVSLGCAEGINKITKWGAPKSFIVGVTEKLDCTLNGRTFALRIEGFPGEAWAFDGMDVDVKYAGGN